jgi:hypothetical protein
VSSGGHGELALVAKIGSIDFIRGQDFIKDLAHVATPFALVEKLAISPTARFSIDIARRLFRACRI